MVDFTNQLVAAIKHPIAWVHMPVPRERDDVADFSPLKGLKTRSPNGALFGTGASHRWFGWRTTPACGGESGD